ncbi:hypothetical protein MBLNU459_g6627t2 [Dothideomycetes sp. NU459]
MSSAAQIHLPALPATHGDFVRYAASNPHMSMQDILRPYKDYESKLREVFAQHPEHPSISEPHLVPLFSGHEARIKIRARELDSESEEERLRYIMPLDAASRRPDGSPAVVQSLKEFRTNFSIFSEASLVDMDWSNVVVAGSAVLTPLIPVPNKYAWSKRALRQYYHEKVAPASDVDLFLYDLTEEQAMEKIKQIEQRVRDSILSETTTIVLRIYRSIAEILTGFDVDCSCVAYDGKQRRAERGRPAIDRWNVSDHALAGNIKDEHDDEIAEFINEDEISSYHTFTIPYGPKYHARKIEKLLYRKDILLNAEWNLPKDREVNLHRHPVFLGRAEDVMQDCCGYCPKPGTLEEQEVAEEEGKMFISGKVTFLKDDPGRQSIGSFNPLTENDWTEMGYIGSTSAFCKAIVDCDLEQVQDWLNQESADPNRRDCTGRTPLQLAVMTSTVQVVQCLIDNGARIVARMADGRTALHLAAMRGNADMVSALLRKSEANADVEASKNSSRAAGESEEPPIEAIEKAAGSVDEEDSDAELVEGLDEGLTTATTDHSLIKVTPANDTEQDHMPVEADEADENDPDIYDIGVLAWDVPVSALHLAIANGHIDVVKVLVQSFGADPAQPIKLYDEYTKRPRAAILSLVVALMLPLEQAKTMTSLLTDLGASPAQADLDQVSALHYFAVKDLELLRELLALSRPKAMRALNHVSMSESQWSPNASNPLCSAIIKGDEDAAKELLNAGATPQIDSKNFSRSYQRKFETWAIGPSSSTQENKDFSRSQLAQPIITAVKCELVGIARDLIKGGADINSLTPDGWKAITPHASLGWAKGMSLLDLVRKKKDDLEEYMKSPWEEGEALSHPIPLQDDKAYLMDHLPDTYAYWSVSKQLQQAKAAHNWELEEYRHHVEQKAQQQGLAEKSEVIRRLYDDFVSFENELVQSGAKSLEELHPDAKKPRYYGRHNSTCSRAHDQPWSPALTFRDSDASEDREVAYRELFQACWDGSNEIVKKLTLTIWEKDQEPLKIAVQDQNGFSPLAICIFRQHYETATLVLEITRMQYDFKVQSDKARFTSKAAECDNGDDDDDDGEYTSNEDEHLKVEIRTVDNEFTVETIGEVPAQARGDCSPLKLLNMRMPVSHFLDEFGPPPEYPTSDIPGTLWAPSAEGIWPSDLFQLAIFRDDRILLALLLKFADTYHQTESEENDASSITFHQFPEEGFDFAIQLGRTDLLSEIMVKTGCGIPFDKLGKNGGVEVFNNPKYYQGLSIHGKKRADWARAGRGARVKNDDDKNPPLLRAARYGNPKSVEWLQSDAPKTCYAKFAAANQNDKRVKGLAEAEDGVLTTVDGWMDRNHHLLLHCIVLGRTTPDSLRLLEHFVSTRPPLLAARALNGQTALHLAFSLHRTEMIEILIAAGADQTTRDKQGNNIIHALLCRNDRGCARDHDSVTSLLSLIDSRLLNSLFIEPAALNAGSASPLARWLDIAGRDGSISDDDEQMSDAKTLAAILAVSKGVELDLINGRGDSPLHDAVKLARVDLMRVILDHRPELLYRENATGQTPYEVAQDAYLSEQFADPPEVPGVRRRGHESVNERRSMVDTAPEDFVKPPDTLSNKVKVWEVCKEFDRKAVSKKRKLVTLHEANEVAKRLAMWNRGSRSRDGQTGEKEPERKDEVDDWYSQAWEYE